jgi:hypothetical protein
METPNLTDEWFKLLFLIQEVLGSNLGLKTDYPDSFSWV